ncbi:MAG TPA: hypothetical protein DCF81_02990 [Erythrobacter sp.]|nr:hypothetical protein [Erythrobacter sp.]
MLVIIGLDALIHASAKAWPIAPMASLSRQFSHAEWSGVHLYDLVFPLFIFLSGVSLAIVDARPSSQALSRGQRLAAAARRAIILILLGIIYNFGWEWSWERLRIPSVLGLIGVSYFIAAATLILVREQSTRIAIPIAIAALVAGLQLFYPVPGAGSGALTPEASINAYIDRLVLPGRLHGGSYDPEGLLGMVSASLIAFAGAGAGAAMVSDSRAGTPWPLGLIGVAVGLAGVALGTVYPPIKSLWTVSFDLVAIGSCLLMLAIARLLFDRKTSPSLLRKAGEVLAPIGANAILAYMAARFFVYPLLAPLARLPVAVEIAGLCALIAIQWLLLCALLARGWILRV